MTAQQRFIENAKHMAFYGLSQSGKGFGQEVFNSILGHRPDLQITVVHPTATQIDGVNLTDTARRIDSYVDCAMIVLKDTNAWDALEDAHRGGIKRVWLVLDAATKVNKQHAMELGMDMVDGCPLLFIPDLGFPHNLHRWLANLFGKI